MNYGNLIWKVRKKITAHGDFFFRNILLKLSSNDRIVYFIYLLNFKFWGNLNGYC